LNLYWRFKKDNGMGRFFAIFKLALKYLYRYRRRYIFLLTALSLCFAVVTFITSTKDGMYENVYYVGQSHYAGDLIIRCYDDGGDGYNLNQNDITAILNAVQVSGINPKHTVLRTMYFDNASVFFNGNAIPIRYVVGCDWENEAFLFSKMTNSENKPVDPITGDDGIVLSLPTAQALGAKIGDSVILEIGTINGQRNTGAFILKEIVKDVSIFGYYKAYVSRTSLNRLKLYDDGNCSIVGLFFDKPRMSEKKRAVLQKTLPQYLKTGEIVYNRDASNKAIDKINGERVFFIYSLPVYLSELSYLLDSMDITAYVIYIMMLLIIMVSTIVTYRLILHERSKEMGIMVTIGFAGRDIRLVLLTEIILLGIISLVLGFVFSYIFSWAVSFISFSWMPSFEIFMKNGRLSPLYLPSTTLVNITIIFLMLFFLTLLPSFRVSRKKIPALLSGEAI
jgi:putative ABC transport system permease protein